jgi:hypothetical protein
MLYAIAITVLGAGAGGQSRLSTPIATISRADVMDAAYTGIGIAASMAGTATGVVAVTDTALVLLEGAEGSITAANTLVEQRLLMITSSREKLEKLRAEGRLHRGDPAYDAMRSQLQRESTLVFPRTRDFVTRAILSREGLLAFGRASLGFGVRSFLGDRFVDIFGPGIRVRSLISTYASRDRSMPRSAWKRIDGIARACGQLIDELTEVAVDKSLQTVEAAAEHSSPCGPVTIAGQSMWVNGFEIRTPGAILNIPCKGEGAPVPAVAATIALQPVHSQFVATPTRELPAATLNGHVVQVPVLLPPPVTGQFTPPEAGTPRLGSAYGQAVTIDRLRNWKE